MPRLLLALSVTLLTLGPVAAQTPKTWDNPGKSWKLAVARYQECMKRLPLVMHYRGWKALAEIGEERALKMLISDYGKAKEPKEQIQGNLVNLALRYHRDPKNLTRFQSWRSRFKGQKHYWLNYRMLELEASMIGPEEHKKLIEKSKDPWTRTAALQAYIEAYPKACYDLAVQLLTKPPRKPVERALLAETLVKGFEVRKRDVGDPGFNAGITKLIMLLDDKKTPHRTKIVLARYFGLIFNSGRRSIVSEPWLLQLKAGRNKDATRGEYAPTFFDIRASGDRIVYAIDMSDSMLTPLSQKFVESKRGTGSRRREKSKDYDPFNDDYDIPWHKVKNRFDLAREQLKVSLYGLKEGKSFTIIGFGDKAELLGATPGLVPANKKNIQRAVRELDRIVPGPTATNRPHGTLRGKTNLHGALLSAFRAKGRGLVKAYEGADPKTFMEGAETIFVLSDGNPTWDDFDMVDVDYMEDNAGDPESGVASNRAENMHYSGPYRDWNRLLEDVQRMNLFRNVEIHCIGIGEVQFSQLDRLAKLGLGKSKRYGT